MFTGILHTDIDAVWPEVSPWIVMACAGMRGKTSPEDFRNFLISRDMQLWLYRDDDGIAAICITEIVNYPHKKYCRIIVGTGRDRRHWQSYRKTIEQWAKTQGCDGMEAYARKGWSRIFDDYRTTHLILEKEF